MINARCAANKTTHVKWWSVNATATLLPASLLSSSETSVGLRLPCVPIVWHAAGNEGAIWRNSAEEMEPHLQVRLSKRCNIFAVWVTRCVRLVALLPRRSPASWDANDLPGAEERLTKCKLHWHSPSLVMRPKGHSELWDHDMHTHTHTSWFVGNFLVLVLKFYNQPEGGSVLKQTSGTFSAPQNGQHPYEIVFIYILECVCVCLALRAIVFAIAFVQWHQWDLAESGQINIHSHTHQSPSPSRTCALSHRGTCACAQHTHTHKESHRNVVLYCCREGALRFTASPWNVGTSELWSASEKLGCMVGWEGERENLKNYNHPQWDHCVYLCAWEKRECEAEGSDSCWPLSGFIYPTVVLIFVGPFLSLQAGVGPGQLQSHTSFHGTRVQTLHFPIPLARPWTGKGGDRGEGELHQGNGNKWLDGD